MITHDTEAMKEKKLKYKMSNFCKAKQTIYSVKTDGPQLLSKRNKRL